MNSDPINHLPHALWFQSQNRQLPNNLVKKLLPGMHNSDPHLRCLIVSVLASADKKTCLPLLIPHLLDTDDLVAQNIISNIKSWLPWTISRPWQPVPAPENILEPAIKSFILSQPTLKVDLRRRFLSRLTHLFGAETEILRALDSVDSSLKNEFECLLNEQLKRNHPPQITIVPTYHCNLNCSYCYAVEHRIEDAAMMPLNLFNRILEHAVNLGFRRIGFTGGEPTLHPQFKEFLLSVRDYCLSTFLATNGTFSYKLIDFLEPSYVGLVTAHLWFNPGTNHPAEPDFVENIKNIRQKGIRVALRYTIREGFPIPIDEIIRLCNNTCVQHINIALAVPSSQQEVFFKNTFINESTRLINTANQFVKHNISFAFAKPIPLCLVSLEEVRWLTLSSPYNIGTCPIWNVGCTHNLLVNNNGNMQPCIVVSDNLGKFLDCADRKEIELRCQSVINSLAFKPLFDKCYDCELWNLKRCQGACLAYKNN